MKDHSTKRAQGSKGLHFARHLQVPSLGNRRQNHRLLSAPQWQSIKEKKRTEREFARKKQRFGFLNLLTPGD